jgi:hypothetical protein
MRRKLPLSELQLDFSWTGAKKTMLDDVHKALVTVGKPELIISSWQKAGLTRCTSGEMYVEASRRQSIRDNKEGSALPNEADTTMDDEEELVLCRDAESVDRGYQQGIS